MSKLQLRSKRRLNSPSVPSGEIKPDAPLNKKPKKTKSVDESDSESSSDEFVRPSKDLEVNSSGILARNGRSPVPDFSCIEKSIFSGVSKLSDSDSDDSDFEEVSMAPSVHAIPEQSNEVTENPLKDSKEGSSSNHSLPEKIQGPKSIESVRNSRSKGKGVAFKSDKVKNETDDKPEVSVKSMGRPARTSKRKPLEEEEDQAGTATAKLKKSKERQQKNALEISSRPSSSSSHANTDSGKKRKKTEVCVGNKKGKAVDKGETSKQYAQNKSKEEKKSNTSFVKEEVQDNLGNLDSLNIAQILALGEGLKLDVKSPDRSDSDNEDWEEVDPTDIKKHEIPKDGVQITLAAPEFSWRRKKQRDQQLCMQAEMNRAFNRVRRELQLLCHKASLLLWLAHGIFLNRVLSSQNILAVALSLIPADLVDPPKAPGRKYIGQILKWFVKDFECSEGFPENVVCSKSPPLTAVLEQHFCRRYAKSTKELTFMFVAVLRAVGVESRLVISFQPMPLKPQSDELLCINSKSKRGRLAKKNPKDNSESEDDPISQSDKPPTKSKCSVLNSSKPTPKPACKSVTGKEDKSSKVLKSGQESPATTSKAGGKGKTQREHGESTSAKSPPGIRGLRSRAKKITCTEEADSDSESSEDLPILSPERKKGGKNTTARLKAAAAKRLPSNRRFSQQATASKTTRKSSQDSDDDSVFEPKAKRNSGAGSSRAAVSPSKQATSRRSHSQKSDSDSDFESKPKGKRGSMPMAKKSPARGRPAKSGSSKSKEGKRTKVLSSDDDSGRRHLTSSAFDYWVEVYLKDEERWTCVDVLSKKIDSTKETLAKATQPVCYVIAYNVDGTLKDVTKRYAPRFSQVTAKQRVSALWWEKSLKSFLPKRSSREIAEDSEMNLVELDRPMPKSVGECKNHPLYVLKRHLLKFEAIYPPDSASLGFVRNEPIYARQNVYTLHSRELWIKEAKVVRLGEEPYKIVKARPKYDKLSGKVITDLPLEVFGPWQVEDYVPPPAIDGKVPRNAYGNVELFKPTMLPKGCVHLQVPSLSRVAKKLHIDCAPAVVGFDYHSGGSHPTFDGFVVCEEYVDVLMDAWNRDIDESAKRREEKHEKRIYGNWRRLIKGLLIREQLKYRYDFNGKNQGEAGSSQSSINMEALKASRIPTETAPLPSLFPKLMANIRARKSTTKEKKKQPKSKNVKPGRKAAPRRKRKDETSEEEESDWDSSSTEEDEVNMVLLSDEDSGSEFEDLKS